MPEHMGHGKSYRLTADPSLVHIDTWKRYVRDFLKICHVIKKTYPELPLVLFAHSMGGAIGTIAAAWEPQLFQKIILNSPMLRPRKCSLAIGDRYCTDEVPFGKKGRLCGWSEAL